MYPLQHLILGTIFSAVLLFLFSNIGMIGFLLIFTSSIFIDIDHYIYYVYKKKDWNLRNAYKWFVENERRILSLPRKKRNEYYSGFVFLHGFDLVILLFLLSIFINKYLFFVGIGFAFHLILDIVGESRYIKRIDKFSLLYDFFKFKKLRIIKEE